MKGVILQVKKEYTNILDAAGCFRRVRTEDEYAVGMEIEVARLPEPQPISEESGLTDYGSAVLY